MLSRDEIKLVLTKALQWGADFAELFIEDREDVTVRFDGAANGAADMRIFGAGVYMIAGKRGAYSYTNDMRPEALAAAVAKNAALLGLKGGGKRELMQFCEVSVEDPCPVRLYPGDVSREKKLRLLEDTDAAARAAAKHLTDIELTYFDRDQRVTVVNTEGVWADDRRVTSRIRFIPTVSDGAETVRDFSDFCAPAGFEAFETGAHIRRLTGVLEDMKGLLYAREAPSARVPVILEGGSCAGTFFHEACGHQLETTALANGGMFFDKRGEQIASAKVTLVDDGTVRGMYGSSRTDDEGMPRQRNTLIENGVLRAFMADRLGALKLSVPRTGSGRRQDYAHAPGARMSNTFLMPGTDDEEAMIRDTDEGLFVTALGGGTGGREFTLMASTAYWIRHGEIICRVKGAMLLGRGDETMKKIDRVGRLFVAEQGGGSFCGAESGFCATTTSGPRMRILEMVVGGKGGAL